MFYLWVDPYFGKDNTRKQWIGINLWSSSLRWICRDKSYLLSIIVLYTQRKGENISSLTEQRDGGGGDGGIWEC